MSEGIVIALIGFAGAVLGAAIAGFATVTAAGIKGKGEGSISCGLVGLLASLGAAGGLVLGAVFGASVIQQRVATSQPPQRIPIPTVAVEHATSAVIVSLKYDETAGVHLVQGQTQLVATYLRRVQAGGSLEEAIQSIKQQAANARATVQEGNTITVQMGQAYFVWCPTADCIYPTNTSFPLQGFRQDYLKVAVIELGEERVVQCPSTCWAVAIH